MKLKSVLILISIFLLITFVLAQSYILSLNYNACDMIEMNDLSKKIEKEINTKSITEAEVKYGCRIIMRKDSGYSNELNAAIKNSDIILDYMEDDKLLGKIILPANSTSFIELKKKLSLILSLTFVIVLILIYAISFYIYGRILRPFKKLERFANNVASGDLDVGLAMEKENYFGAFTESFDMMRTELKRARMGEYQANISKKELVAGLSHDIKTPVATIKAICELLEVKVKEEETVMKLQTIEQKADIIDKLISNMFHATLEELEVLKIEPKEEYSTIIAPMFEDLNYYGKIHINNSIPGCLIYCDKLRLNQVIDNVINNSYKYANSRIDISYGENERFIEIVIRDYGTGINETDMPLIYEKFFRGENSASHSGSGLGLYLAKVFMEGMQGSIECRVDKGFVVKLMIKKT